eukprot:scaffold136088_cov32-Tisochrysis_lutea.AAC.1
MTVCLCSSPQWRPPVSPATQSSSIGRLLGSCGTCAPAASTGASCCAAAATIARAVVHRPRRRARSSLRRRGRAGRTERA